MDMRYERRNVLPHARVNFSLSKTSSLLRGEGGEGELKRKDPEIFQTYYGVYHIQYYMI